MYEYEFNGMINCGGCSLVKVTNKYFILFENGSKAFIKNKAKKGILEFIFIKNSYVNENFSSRNGMELLIIYQDTLNRIWAEEELVFENEATNYFKQYWSRVNRGNSCNPN